MDATAHYRNLAKLGREEFLAAAAPAALVRTSLRGLVDSNTTMQVSRATTHTVDDEEPGETIQAQVRLPTSPPVADLEIYPLAKKPGASFPDRITIGRTPNNDIVISDQSISRLHAYVRAERGAWFVADAGSKNGSWLDKLTLDARKERPIQTKAKLRLGDIDLMFFLAQDLFTILGGA
ncbi:MAG TPA: FHA domain-containing protein [Kofleriaceae bacterium]